MKKIFTSDGWVFAVQWLANILPSIKPDKKYSIEVKEHRERRSLKANNYAWELMEQIAKASKVDKREVYHQMLMAYGTDKRIDGELYTVTLKAEIELSLKTDEYLYVHTSFIGESVLNGKLAHHYKVIKGSSEYNTKEMSDFIDGIVQEAQQLDIDTRTPDEIALMKSRWAA